MSPDAIRVCLDVTTSPVNRDRYQIGQVYAFGIWTHTIEAVCVHSDGEGHFHFDEISDKPRPNEDQEARRGA